MAYDFDIEWCLQGARYVTKEEYDMVTKNPHDQNAIQKLAEHNISYGHSCDVLNTYCKEELARYRESIVTKQPKEKQDVLLNTLYNKYTKEFKKHKNIKQKPNK